MRLQIEMPKEIEEDYFKGMPVRIEAEIEKYHRGKILI